MIFLDSSFLISVEVETDQNHAEAIRIRNDIIKGKYGKIFISDYIFDETVTVTFGRMKSLQKAVLVGSGLMESAEILKVDKGIFRKAWELFKGQKSTRLSFTDCTTVSIMEENGIESIATFDGDFARLGTVNVIS